MEIIWYALAAFTAALILTDCFGYFKKNQATQQAAPYLPPEERKIQKESSEKAAVVKKTQFELDRDLVKKANDVWNRCADRSKTDKSKEMLCSFGSYCVNEFLNGKCTNPQMREIFYGISDKKVQDLFPYNEEQFDQEAVNTPWPPRSKYNDKPKKAAAK